MVNGPTGSIPPGAFKDTKALEGRVVRTSLEPGEPVIEAKLAPQGTKGGLSAGGGAGERGGTGGADEVGGVAGLPRAGGRPEAVVEPQQAWGNDCGPTRT